MKTKLEKLVLASGNKGKLREFGEIFGSYDVELLAQSQFSAPEVAETGASFVENAIIKARHAAEVTGLPVLADDSGIAVSALGGEPGIYSARYAGENASDQDNIRKLLESMKSVPEEERHAAFYCVLVFMRHADDPVPIIANGIWEGQITMEEHGQAGFGYDPIFYIPELECTSAMLSKEQKNAMSHRGKAVANLLPQMQHFGLL